MSEFTTVLRSRVEETQQAVTTAWKSGNDQRARTYAYELADLLELAIRHDVDTAGWVAPTVRSYATRWS